MRSELPVCKRCCFCLPLRYGLIFWGYLKIITSCLYITSITLTVIDLINDDLIESIGDLDGLITVITIGVIIAISSIILNIILIVGCHKKNVRLIKIYYIFSMVLLGLITTLSVYYVTVYIYYSQMWISNYTLNMIISDTLKFVIIFGNTALQCYIILLVRSEMIKLNNGCQFRFVNNAEAAQCTLSVEHETVDNEKNNSRLDNDDIKAIKSAY